MTDLSPRIDHVVVNVLDRLDEAAGTYRRLGFQLTPRGHHTLGSSNNLTIFGTDYLELLGFEPGRAAQRPELWGSPPGLGGLVFKPPADRGFSEGLKSRGVQASDPREFSRPVDLPDGPHDASFRVVNIDDADVGGRVFFCHHYTPELVWRDEWQHHPNGAIAVREFAISCNDPTATATPFAKMFGAAALQPIDGGLVLAAGEAKVYFLTAAALIRQYGPTVPVAEHGTARMSALGLRTRDLAQAGAILRSAAVEGITEINGRLIVPPAQACGVTMAFSG